MNQTYFNITDEQSMNRLFRDLFPKLLYYAKGIIHEGAESEDIVMTAFGKLWQRRAEYGSLPAVEGFLHLTVHNACLNFIAHQKVKSKKQQDILLMNKEAEDYLEHRYITAEIAQIIYHEMESLPPQSREVVKLFFIHGLSHAEIAARMNIEEKTVRNHKSRALELIRLSLAKKNLLTINALATLIILSGDNLPL